MVLTDILKIWVLVLKGSDFFLQKGFIISDILSNWKLVDRYGVTIYLVGAFYWIASLLFKPDQSAIVFPTNIYKLIVPINSFSHNRNNILNFMRMDSGTPACPDSFTAVY